MKITIKEKEIDLKYSMRLYIVYENITDDTVDFTKMDSMRVLTTLLYSTIISTLQSNKESLDISYDDFMDWLDENGGTIVLSEFATWFAGQLEIQYALDPKKQKENIKESKNKPKKAKD